MIWFYVWSGCAVLSAIVARSKRRHAGDWFLLGVALGPLAFIAILLMPIASIEEKREATPLPAKPGKIAITLLGVVAMAFIAIVVLIK